MDACVVTTKKAVLLHWSILALLMLILAPGMLAAQRIGVISAGPVFRNGDLPAAYDAGIRTAVALQLQQPLIGILQLTLGVDGSSENLDVEQYQEATGLTAGQTYSFLTGELGIGPGFAVQRRGLNISGAVQAAWVHGHWGSGNVGSCGTGCTFVGPAPKDKLGEWHRGTAARLRLLWGKGRERFGVEVRTAFIPDHVRSGIPLGGVTLMLAIGGFGRSSP